MPGKTISYYTCTDKECTEVECNPCQMSDDNIFARIDVGINVFFVTILIPVWFGLLSKYNMDEFRVEWPK